MSENQEQTNKSNKTVYFRKKWDKCVDKIKNVIKYVKKIKKYKSWP